MLPLQEVSCTVLGGGGTMPLQNLEYMTCGLLILIPYLILCPLLLTMAGVASPVRLAKLSGEDFRGYMMCCIHNASFCGDHSSLSEA